MHACLHTSQRSNKPTSDDDQADGSPRPQAAKEEEACEAEGRAGFGARADQRRGRHAALGNLQGVLPFAAFPQRRQVRVLVGAQPSDQAAHQDVTVLHTPFFTPSMNALLLRASPLVRFHPHEAS